MIQCPVCMSINTDRLATTAPLPISIMQASDDPLVSQALTRKKMNLRRCGNCQHVFNNAFEPSLVDYEHQGCRMFNNGQGWQYHIRDLQDYISLQFYDTIVEIGPGDGEFLAGVKAGKKIVYEPSDDAAACEAKGFETHRSYFTDITPLHEGPKTLYLMRHALEHFEYPADFLELFTARWHAEYPVDMIVEVPCVHNALTNLRVEDWVYEHPQHFTFPSLSRLFTRCGWHTKRIETKYGSEILVLHAQYKPSAAGRALNLAQDKFSLRYTSGLEDANKQLCDYIAEGKTIAYWGGLGKSSMFLHQIGICPMLVVDSDERKVGLCVPGLSDKIHHRSLLESYPVDIIVITTSWRADDIVAEIKRHEIRYEKILVYKRGRLVEYEA